MACTCGGAFDVACAAGCVACAAALMAGETYVGVTVGLLWASGCRERANGRGYAAVVRMLLSSPHVNPDIFSSLALRRAIESGGHAVARVLLADPRVSLSVRRRCALPDRPCLSMWFAG